MLDVKQCVIKETEYLRDMRRCFHKNPEPSLQEYQTAKRIEEELESFGIAHQRVGETGVLGILVGTGVGNDIIALRADIDALRIQETVDAPYASEVDGVMHACGHDAHTAALLGSAKILAENKHAFGGEIRFIFQPAEEVGRGAKPFVEAGVMNGVKRVFGVHVASDLPVGTVGLKPGMNNASVDHFAINIQGKSVHVSTPHLGADALYIACQSVVALQGLVTRCTSPVEPVILGIGKLNAGTTYNAVAEFAELEGTTRTVSQKMRTQMQENINKTVHHIAEIYGAKAEIIWTDYAAPLVNSAEVCLEVGEIVNRIWGEGKVITDRNISMGGDNFGEFLLYAPGAYAFVGSANPALENTKNAHHNGNFDIDEQALEVAASLYVGYALEQLKG